MYYSQSNQDRWVEEIYAKKYNGFFLDVGAYDGIQTSNTYFLEKELGWRGICIEANTEVFKKLQVNRSSKNVCLAVMNYQGKCNFSETTVALNGQPVSCDTLDNILTVNNAPNVIDYLSIDIEGSELIALRNFPFNKWKIGAITIEHNLYLDGPAKKDEIFELLSKNNFERRVEDVKCLDPYYLWYMKPYEDWYVNRDFKL